MADETVHYPSPSQLAPEQRQPLVQLLRSGPFPPPPQIEYPGPEEPTTLLDLLTPPAGDQPTQPAPIEDRRLIGALDLDDVAAQSPLALAQLAELRDELERERLRLAACGVVAMADTPESAAKARNFSAEFASASCDDVAARVDECIALRADNKALRKELDTMTTRLLDYQSLMAGRTM